MPRVSQLTYRSMKPPKTMLCPPAPAWLQAYKCMPCRANVEVKLVADRLYNPEPAAGLLALDMDLLTAGPPPAC